MSRGFARCFTKNKLTAGALAETRHNDIHVILLYNRYCQHLAVAQNLNIFYFYTIGVVNTDIISLYNGYCQHCQHCQQNTQVSGICFEHRKIWLFVFTINTAEDGLECDLRVHRHVVHSRGKVLRFGNGGSGFGFRVSGQNSTPKPEPSIISVKPLLVRQLATHSTPDPRNLGVRE